jgi:hypothetical protein
MDDHRWPQLLNGRLDCRGIPEIDADRRHVGQGAVMGDGNDRLSRRGRPT